jgi:serine/threonine-protein kinase
LADGASAPTVLPFTGLDHLYGVAVDGAGSVYVTESNSYTRDTSRVAKLAAAAGPQTELPLPGLKVPYGVAVDGAGSVYVADYGNQQVVKLPAS